MTKVEAAQVLGLTERTTKYYWTHARAWLITKLTPLERAGNLSFIELSPGSISHNSPNQSRTEWA
jgi:hypothetical protein